MNDARIVPWRRIADWRCISCGDCCRLYSVVINFHEWLKIVKNFGIETTTTDLDKLFIKRNGDGSCAFLCRFPDTHACGLQQMKPKACQLWPFKVLGEPRYGYPNEAVYRVGTDNLFIYADGMCNGLRLGTPTPEFASGALREFVEIALGLRSGQFRTTSTNSFGRRFNSWQLPRRF